MRRGRQKMSCRRQIADVIVGRPFLGVDIITSKHFGKSIIGNKIAVIIEKRRLLEEAILRRRYF